MENNTNPIETQSKSLIENEFENLSITNLSESYLLSAAKWSKFLAIVGFIMIGFMVIFGVSFMGIFKTLGEYQNTSMVPMMGAMSYMWIIYIILGAIYFFPTYYLLIFANKTKQALVEKNQILLEEGFKNMKRLAKFVGILTIVIIVLYVIFIFAAIVVSISGASALM